MEETNGEGGGTGERRRKKVRIRYKERVRIKDRPRFYHLRRTLRKRLPQIVSATLLLAVLGAIIYYGINAMVEMENDRKEKMELLRKTNKKK